MKNNFNWMLFRPEGSDVIYIWNGEFPIVVHCPEHEGSIKYHTWLKDGDTNTTEEDAKELDAVTTSSKRVFTVKSHGKRRYAVISRGTYNYQTIE